MRGSRAVPSMRASARPAARCGASRPATTGSGSTSRCCESVARDPPGLDPGERQRVAETTPFAVQMSAGCYTKDCCSSRFGGRPTATRSHTTVTGVLPRAVHSASTARPVRETVDDRATVSFPRAGMTQPTPPATGDVVIRQGSIVVQRLFDIAYATDLVRLEALCADAQGSGGSRARLAATPDKAVTFGNPPLTLPLAGLSLEFDGETFDCAVSANFYDFGALTIAIDVPVRARSWSALVALSRAVD